MHHASDLNIPLPSDFDMVHYKNLNRADKIDYAKQKLPRETRINYQNEIGKSMSPLFGPKETFLVPGFAGKFKQNTELTIQQTDTPDKTILSLIREDGVHISSFSVNNKVLRKITKYNFWVLKNRNLESDLEWKNILIYHVIKNYSNYKKIGKFRFWILNY
jgi:hypothetical protein